MTSIKVAHSDLEIAAMAIPEGVPIVMLNMVKFKAEADYGNRTDQEPCSGEEAYTMRYAPAFGEVVEELGLSGGVPVFVGSVHAHIVAPPDEKWDMVILVEYPSYEVFRQIVESKQYAEKADMHRVAALENWRLIATTKMM
eukprot:gene12240-14173_t